MISTMITFHIAAIVVSAICFLFATPLQLLKHGAETKRAWIRDYFKLMNSGNEFVFCLGAAVFCAPILLWVVLVTTLI